MKKILGLFVALVSLIVFNVKAAEITLPPETDHEKIHLYLFYSSTCPHCHDFLTYFNENYNDDYAKYFEIYTFESSEAENYEIDTAVRDELNIEDKDHVPLIVWGEENQIGFGTDGSDIIKSVLEQYQNEDYRDVVGEILANTDADYKEQNLEDTLVSMGIKRADNAIPDWAIMTIIFVVLVGGIGGLFFLARKK